MEEEQKISKYNYGINIIMRLDSLWRETHLAVKLNKYFLWNTLLDRIWCELARDIKTDDYEDKIDKEENVIKQGFKSKFDDINKKIASLGRLLDDMEGLGLGFQEIPKSVIDNRTKQYKALVEKDLFLRRLENHVGKGTAWEEAQDDWD